MRRSFRRAAHQDRHPVHPAGGGKEQFAAAGFLPVDHAFLQAVVRAMNGNVSTASTTLAFSAIGLASRGGAAGGPRVAPLRVDVGPTSHDVSDRRP